ncbi:GTP cyclohydrolase 1 isoform X2 [Elaeis guineensis]|uniref:GTP cyclohydrolase 1 n=1 Tax=Elaeis guineensis var. tenera TaxID=51953 RepID=A0A6J0PAR4_ELAGV|nr:GTP cyclohydrolase 1 isoform X1 [Elaeis guineensis]
MGALEEARFEGELENGVGLDEPEEELDAGSGLGSRPEATRAIEEVIRVLLQGLGEDPEREGLRKTPLRVAKAFREGTRGCLLHMQDEDREKEGRKKRGYRQKVKDIVQGALFPEAGLDNGTGHAGGAGGLVVVREISLFSYCESCLLPFSIQCHVGYVPSGQRVVGLSKLSRVADVFAKRLQDPQRLSDDICAALQNSINPAGVAVALQCWHIQFPEVLRCNPNPKHLSKSDMQGWVQASVCSSSGVFEVKGNSFWNDFLALLKFRGINLEGGSKSCFPVQSWCPSRSLEVPLCNGHSTKSPNNGKVSSKPGHAYAAMVAAVTSILYSLGEDPMRKELIGTPYRYVQWLMNFKSSNLDFKMNGFNLGKLCLHKTGDVVNSQCHIHSVLNLPFCSQCEHHLLPFHGVVHIGYFDEEEGKHIERSIFQSMVHYYGCKLQVQERLTRQIAEAVHVVFRRGVMVVVEANHICMISRGIEKVGSSTATIAVMGQFSTDPAAKALFLQTISNSTASGG